jgi:hypothetical protein
MAAIKSVARSATVAFAPTAPDIVALGTMSGAIDASFSASASLDVFQIDFSRPDPDLDLLASVSSNEKFNRLSWGAAGAAGEAHPYGLLAGGLADGTVCVWNPAPFIRFFFLLSFPYSVLFFAAGESQIRSVRLHYDFASTRGDILVMLRRQKF